MQLDKAAVTAKLRADGEHDRAAAADTALPRHVDTDRDAGLLRQFDVNVGDLTEEADRGRARS